MSMSLERIINDVDSLKKDKSNASESLQNLSKELNNIKILVSPVNIKISSNASKLASVMGAMLKCSFSIAPGSYLSVRAKTLVSNLPSSNISDSKLGVNVVPFAGCTSPTNPFFKPPFIVPPLPCIPQLSPFTPTNPKILLENMPITTINSKAMCTFAPGGVVSFVNSNQINVKTS